MFLIMLNMNIQLAMKEEETDNLELPITYHEFVEIFEPEMVADGLTEHPKDIGFDTFYGYLDNNSFIWTLLGIDSEAGCAIASGRHRINRLEHYCCKYPVPNGISFYEYPEERL